MVELIIKAIETVPFCDFHKIYEYVYTQYGYRLSTHCAIAKTLLEMIENDEIYWSDTLNCVCTRI